MPCIDASFRHRCFDAWLEYACSFAGANLRDVDKTFLRNMALYNSGKKFCYRTEVLKAAESGRIFARCFRYVDCGLIDGAHTDQPTTGDHGACSGMLQGPKRF